MPLIGQTWLSPLGNQVLILRVDSGVHHRRGNLTMRTPVERFLRLYKPL